MRTTVKSILKEIGCPKLNLYQGIGYLYFVYNDPINDIYDTHSVCVYKLNHLPKEDWVREGNDFVAKVQA